MKHDQAHNQCDCIVFHLHVIDSMTFLIVRSENNTVSCLNSVNPEHKTIKLEMQGKYYRHNSHWNIDYVRTWSSLLGVELITE